RTVYISKLDFAVMQDLGMAVRLPTSGDDVIHGLSNGDDIHLGAGNDIGYAWSFSSTGSTIYGESGNDTFYGGVGADTFYGGAGGDTYILPEKATTFTTQIDKTIIEAANEGVDTIQSARSFALPANVENITLTGN